MEYGSRIRFFLLTIGAIILLVLSAWGIASIAKKVFSGSGNKSTTAQTEKVELTDYMRPNTSVKISVYGPVVADEKYESYEIEVGQDFRRITVYKGYGNTVVFTKTYDNNAEAYESFLKSLAKYSYTTKANNSAGDDERGSCPTGFRYVYEVKDFDETPSRLWGVSCGAKIGSFAGNGPSTRALFKAQIPEYTAIAKNHSIIR